MKQSILTTVFAIFILAGCTKVGVESKSIDLGTIPAVTAITSLKQIGNIITVEFAVTSGSKYSVQFVPFGSDKVAKSEGFTAETDKITKVYDLTSLKKMDYDLILIDISGKETKRPILIK